MASRLLRTSNLALANAVKKVYKPLFHCVLHFFIKFACYISMRISHVYIENKLKSSWSKFVCHFKNYATAADIETLNKTTMQKKIQVKFNGIYLNYLETWNTTAEHVQFCISSFICQLACLSKSSIRWTSCRFHVARRWHWAGIDATCSRDFR